VKIYTRYVLSIALCLLLTTVFLVASGPTTLEDFFTIYIIEALVITEFFVYLNARARRALNMVSAVLFCSFIVVLCVQIARVLR
jgi:hypothetical protein